MTTKKIIFRMIVILLIQAIFTGNAVLIPASDINRYSLKIKTNTLAPRINISLKSFQEFFRTAGSVESHKSGIGIIDEARYQNLFNGVNFGRFSQLDAHKLKIAILLKNNLDISGIDEKSVVECRMLLDEALNLFNKLFPVSGTPDFDPLKLFKETKVSPANIHLVCELAKEYTESKPYKAVIERMYNESPLFLLPVKPGEKYHISLLDDLNGILLAGGKIKESGHSLSGRGVYYFQMGNSNEVDAGTRLARFFTARVFSLLDYGSNDYVIMAYRQKITRLENKSRQPVPLVIQIKPDIPSEAAQGWPYQEQFKKSGRVILGQLGPGQYDILLNLNSLYLADYQALKKHLIAKNLIVEENGIIRPVDQKRQLPDKDGVNTGWLRFTFDELKYEVVDLMYTRKDLEMEALSLKMSVELKELLDKQFKIQAVMDTGSSARGFTVDKPDFDFQIELKGGEDYSLFIAALKSGEIFWEFLQNHVEALEKLYNKGPFKIMLEKPHSVSVTTYLIPFKFVSGNEVIGGTDFNLIFPGNNSSGIAYHNGIFRQQLNAILAHVPAAQHEGLRQHLAEQIKTIKRFLVDNGLYKNSTEKRNRFIGIAVEQMIMNIGSYVPIRENVSAEEIKKVYSYWTALYMLSNLKRENLARVSFPALEKDARTKWFVNAEHSYELRDDTKSLLPRIGSALDYFIEYALSNEVIITKKRKVANMLEEILTNPANKAKLIGFIAGYNSELEAAIALGRTKGFAKWDFVERWELVRQAFAAYKAEIDIFAMAGAQTAPEVRFEVARIIGGLRKNIKTEVAVSGGDISAKDINKWFSSHEKDDRQLFRLYMAYAAESSGKLSLYGFAEFLLKTIKIENPLIGAGKIKGAMGRKDLIDQEISRNLVGAAI